MNSARSQGLFVGDVIAAVERMTPPRGVAATVDTLKSGRPEDRVRGIVVTFAATLDVLRRAVALGANLIVTHEPTFYGGDDDTGWLVDDPVYQAKWRFITDHDLVIWRFHDGCHRLQPDGIVAGMVRRLGWSYAPPAPPHIAVVAPQSVRDLVAHCRQRLGIAAVRVVGPLDARCARVGLLVGAAGGRAQIRAFQEHNVDVVVCGESPEWETCEYVRDAVAAGLPRALVVLGHANSEEAGIGWVAEWLRSLLPTDVPVLHVPAGDPFHVL